jgi:hypothetical protein
MDFSSLPLFAFFKAKPQAPAGRSRAPRATGYTLTVEEFTVDVRRKPVRTLRLSLRPADGAVRVSAPLRLSEKAVRAFVASHVDWIRAQRARLARVERPKVPALLDGSSVAFLGRALPLNIVRGGQRALARFEADGTLLLRLPEQAPPAHGDLALRRCLARELLGAARLRLPRWESALGVRCTRLKVRPMRSRWGSCATTRGVITLSTELAHRDPAFLDYILLHELAHLLEANHGPRFKALLDRHLPDWRALRRSLNGRNPD